MLFVNLTRVNCSPGTVHEGPNSSERDSTNYAPLSVYSTVLQIGVRYLNITVSAQANKNNECRVTFLFNDLLVLNLLKYSDI